MKKIILPILASIFVLILLFSYQTAKFSDNVLHVVFCDVGQGDAIYVRTPGKIDILVDSGRADNKALSCLNKHMPIWDRTIEIVFATHPDADHIGGFLSVLKSYKVKEFNTVAAKKGTKQYFDLVSLLKELKVPYKEITLGSKFTLSDGVTIRTLWPAAGFDSKDTNEFSLVQLLSFGNFDLLLTGDITYQILNTLNLPSSVEVFKLPHHGSKTGVDEATFQRMSAVLAIVSAGKNNSYHHPHPSVLSLLNKHGVSYRRTDEIGSIEIITDGIQTRALK
jgi:competence protein ComEC